MKDIIRVGAAAPSVRAGNVDFNLSQIRKYIREAKEKGVRVLAFPELCLTGYTCGDLFLNESLTDAAAAALLSLEREADGIAFAVGAPLRLRGRLCNCAIFFARKKILGVIPKLYLANDGVASERRLFRPGWEFGEESIPLGGRDIPFGGGLIFEGEDGTAVGIEICEDFWTPIPPGSYLAMGGANIILNLSASPASAGKRERRRSLVAEQSARLMALYVYACAGYEESTADFVCDGHSIIASGGRCIAESEGYADCDYLLFADSDLGCGRADRVRSSSFSDSVFINKVPEKIRYIKEPGLRYTCGDPPADRLCINRYPFIPEGEATLGGRVAQLFELQATALSRRLELTGCRPVIGVSGGLDSTLALLVALRALERLGRPASDVLGITMPCFGTGSATFSTATELMESLGVESRTINIEAAVRRHFADIGQPEDRYDAAYENAQARERTQVLMDIANSVGGLVVGTGDLSELALGWCTYNGDHMSMYAVNASLPKTLIREMVRLLAGYERFAPAGEILRRVIEQPISPELLPPDAEGGISQRTEDIVGPYELHDFFLFYMLRFGYSPGKIFYLAKLAFAGSFSDEDIKGWLKVFLRRFFSSQFKRSVSPDSVMLGSVFLSPRGGWNVPSDADGSLWLREAEQL